MTDHMNQSPETGADVIQEEAVANEPMTSAVDGKPLTASDSGNETPAPKQKRAFFALRAIGVTGLLALLLGVVYLAGYHAYPTVAEWVEPGDHSAFVYDEQTYYLAAQLGKRGLSKNNYKVDKLIGKVHDDGVPTKAPETEPETLPEDTEWLEETEDPAETEPETQKPENADPTLARDHAYVLYSVEKKPEYLLLLAEDGELYVYYREDVENPVKKN